MFHLFSLGTESDAVTLRHDLEEYHDVLLFLARRAAEQCCCDDVTTGAVTRTHSYHSLGNTWQVLQHSLHPNLQQISSRGISNQEGNGEFSGTVILSGMKGLARLYGVMDNTGGPYDLSKTLASMDYEISHVSSNV